MKITSFSRDFGKSHTQWDAFRKEIEIALRTVCDKYNIDVKAGRARYQEISAEIDLTFTTKAGDGASIDLEAEEFKRYATRYGMSASDLGKRIILSGQQYEIVGMTKTKAKYPILAKNLVDKKRYKLTAATVKKGLENAKGNQEILKSDKLSGGIMKSGLFDND